MTVPEITVAEAARMRDDGTPFELLDVREDDELATVRVGFARHLPMAQVPQHLDDLPRDRPLVVMCHHGGRSARVTSFLRDRGFENAVNLAGGIDAWADGIDPSLARY